MRAPTLPRGLLLLALSALCLWLWPSSRSVSLGDAAASSPSLARAAVRGSATATPRQKRVAFVVLVDPHEDHFINVVPMLAHVEGKYGQYGHPYVIFTDGELPSEAVRNATFRATNGKAMWVLIDEATGWGAPPWINLDVLNLGVPDEYRHYCPVRRHAESF